jgi:hypothetical protein
VTAVCGFHAERACRASSKAAVALRTLDDVSMPSPGEQLAHSIAAAADAEPRMRMLLWPRAQVVDGREQLSFYCADIPAEMVGDIVIDVDDYADVPADVAAAQIISELFR